ncbi:hypothetical protein H5410_025812 [Solanum commersonii]|uniref:Uncharacterized protein n=1 Tax=Solanum commersonii TaxID=4109 RepID=A0A9J5YWY3_SOLCO|nr:hypothetical protein H5410_025812 [Solanum commersonii]
MMLSCHANFSKQDKLLLFLSDLDKTRFSDRYQMEQKASQGTADGYQSEASDDDESETSDDDESEATNGYESEATKS